jgi:hypothetical protein
MGRVAYCPRGRSPIPLPKHDAYVLRTNPGNFAMFAAILRASSFVSNLALEGRQISRVPSTLVKYDGGQIRLPITPSNRTALAIPLQFVQPNVDRRTHLAQ